MSPLLLLTGWSTRFAVAWRRPNFAKGLSFPAAGRTWLSLPFTEWPHSGLRPPSESLPRHLVLQTTLLLQKLLPHWPLPGGILPSPPPPRAPPGAHPGPVSPSPLSCQSYPFSSHFSLKGAQVNSSRASFSSPDIEPHVPLSTGGPGVTKQRESWESTQWAPSGAEGLLQGTQPLGQGGRKPQAEQIQEGQEFRATGKRRHIFAPEMWNGALDNFFRISKRTSDV